MSARGMPFSFSMYSKTERISLLIGLVDGKKKAGRRAHFSKVRLIESGNLPGGQKPCQAPRPPRVTAVPPLQSTSRKILAPGRDKSAAPFRCKPPAHVIRAAAREAGPRRASETSSQIDPHRFALQ